MWRTTCGGILILSLMAGTAAAHGGHSAPTAETAEPQAAPAESGAADGDNPYAAEAPAPDATAAPFARGGLGDETPGHAERHGEPASQGMDHARHKEIRIATHEWVAGTRHGYGAAAGITALAGLAFAALCLKRTG